MSDLYDLERNIASLEREIGDVRHEVGKKADIYDLDRKAEARDLDALESRVDGLREALSELQETTQEILRRLPK